MKDYRLLVVGNNEKLIHELFEGGMEYFDVLSCSKLMIDKKNHIDFFDPHFFVICLDGESAVEMSEYGSLKRKLTDGEVFSVVIGTPSECEDFQNQTGQLADDFIEVPVSGHVVIDKLLDEIKQLEGTDNEMDVVASAQQPHEMETITLDDIMPAEKKRVLIIDDDPLMLKLIKEYLGDKYTVASAISGKVAYKFLDSKVTDLILLDYEMPEENGVEVFKKLRANAKLANTPIVFLTGMADREKLTQVLALKPQGYLLKPIERDKLLGTVYKFLG